MRAIFPKLEIKLNLSNQAFLSDPGQLEQALINLIKNAFEASKKNEQVLMQWHQDNEFTQIDIIDSGTGIANLDNLFVPFYSTKEQGSGIGLIISREFIRNQQGELDLKNRTDSDGAIATISLPNFIY
nr:ATP-binding protein [Pseudoalteromonas sp. C2R02]